MKVKERGPWGVGLEVSRDAGGENVDGCGAVDVEHRLPVRSIVHSKWDFSWLWVHRTSQVRRHTEKAVTWTYSIVCAAV